MEGTGRHLLLWKNSRDQPQLFRRPERSRSFSILQQTVRYYCHKLIHKQCWYDILTALCTGPQRKDLADYSLRCAVNASLHFMLTAFPYRIFIFNLIGNCNISTHFCKQASNLIKVSTLCMNLYRMAQHKLWKRVLLLCCLRHLSFTEIAQYPVRLTCKASFTVSSVGLCNRYAWKNLQSTVTNNNICWISCANDPFSLIYIEYMFEEERTTSGFSFKIGEAWDLASLNIKALVLILSCALGSFHTSKCLSFQC